MIRFKNITMSYGDHQVLEDVNFTFKKGEITVILGPSGCGKSTLLKLINKSLSPDSGSIYIHEKNIETIESTKLKRSIGYAIQGVGLFPHMNVKANIETVPKLLKWPKDQIEERVVELMDMIGLSQNFKKKYPIQLSGGEAQRVGVARALAGNPDILLMDEPFGALDPITRAMLQKSLLKIQKKLKKTIIFVTHDVSEALIMSDNLVLMSDQKIIASGKPYDIVSQSKDLLKSFAGGSFALDMLERHLLLDVLNVLPKTVEKPASDINAHISLKEALAEMMMRERDYLVIEHDHTFYHLAFTSLLEIIKGLNHV